MLGGSKNQAKNELTMAELSTALGVSATSDYNSYAGSLGSAIVRSNAVMSLKGKTRGGW